MLHTAQARLDLPPGPAGPDTVSAGDEPGWVEHGCGCNGGGWKLAAAAAAGVARFGPATVRAALAALELEDLAPRPGRRDQERPAA